MENFNRELKSTSRNKENSRAEKYTRLGLTVDLRYEENRDLKISRLKKNVRFRNEHKR